MQNCGQSLAIQRRGINVDADNGRAGTDTGFLALITLLLMVPSTWTVRELAMNMPCTSTPAGALGAGHYFGVFDGPNSDALSSVSWRMGSMPCSLASASSNSWTIVNAKRYDFDTVKRALPQF